MRELSACEIVGVWERGRARSHPERALELLAAGGCPGSVEQLSVGERDAQLIELRELTFGPSLDAVVSCPSCEEVLELEVAVSELYGGRAPAGGQFALDVDGRRVWVRLPTAGDLVAVARAAEVEEGRALLLERCVADAALTREDEASIAARIAEADPDSWIELVVTCPACAQEWNAPFDIVSFLWAEVDACVRQLMGEVHALASAYGWSERDVLALSAARRESYLALVG